MTEATPSQDPAIIRRKKAEKSGDDGVANSADGFAAGRGRGIAGEEDALRPRPFTIPQDGEILLCMASLNNDS